MFMQSGLTVKWQKDSSFYFRLEDALRNRHSMKEAKVKLNIKNLLLAFVGLCVGLVLSTFVFLIERCCYTKKNLKIKT